MALRISASGLFQSNRLDVTPTGVKYFTNSLFSAKRVFLFSQIECVLLSESGLLSFQVAGEAFKIQTKPDNARHAAVIDALLNGIRAVNGAAPIPSWR